ncbi:hypothetical protein NL676_018454 [Syzygium grande]|nr:hypothetical protein NL676_018454 [Syzygium grande]
MGFSLLPRNTRELWKEWQLRLLILLSSFLQLTLATQGSKRKSISSKRIQFMVWTMYLLAESVATVMLGVLSNRLANIKETKGTFDPQSQITAFWVPFLLCHLGGPDTITAFAQADNELWLRQLARLCVQVGLAGYIYYMALSGTTLSLIAQGMILVGFIKYAERTLCLYLASKDRLEDSMRLLPKSGPIYPRKMEQYVLKKEEDVQASLHGPDPQLRDLATSNRIFMDLDSVTVFKIMEIELKFMYDLLYTKAPLLNYAWGIIRWVIGLLVPCAVLVLFSFQDKKNYPKVDICISVTILLEIYVLLLAIQSDWVDHWQLQKPKGSTISSAITFLRFFPNQRWKNSVAQFSLLSFSIGKGNRIFRKCHRLNRFVKKAEKIFYVGHKEFRNNFKEWIFSHMRKSIKLEASEVLKMSNCIEVNWSVEVEFDQSIIIWHIATELSYYKDRGKMHGEILEDKKFLEDKQAVLSKKEGRISSVIKWAQKLFKEEEHGHAGDNGCNKSHKSRESPDLCKVCHLLLKVETHRHLPAWKMHGDKSTSVLFDACYLTFQLNEVPRKWDLIGKHSAARTNSRSNTHHQTDHELEVPGGMCLLVNVMFFG